MLHSNLAPTTVNFNYAVLIVSFIVKFVDVMERFPRVVSVTSRVLKPLKYFCCCLKLNIGVRTITAVSGVFGVVFVLLGSEVDDDEAIAPVFSIACQATGFMFFIWFLTLLLLLSLDINLPKTLSVWIGYVLASWSFVSSTGFIILLVKRKINDEIRIVLICAILISIFDVFMTVYSVWVLKSYFYSIVERRINQIPPNSVNKRLNAIQQPAHIESLSPSSASLRSKSSKTEDFITVDERFPEDSQSVLSSFKNVILNVKDKGKTSKIGTNLLYSSSNSNLQSSRTNVFFYHESKKIMFSRSQQTSPTSSYSSINILN